MFVCLYDWTQTGQVNSSGNWSATKSKQFLEAQNYDFSAPLKSFSDFSSVSDQLDTSRAVSLEDSTVGMIAMLSSLNGESKEETKTWRLSVDIYFSASGGQTGSTHNIRKPEKKTCSSLAKKNLQIWKKTKNRHLLELTQGKLLVILG